ncbi:MAG: PAS domain-containing protein [Elusimicrobia bacterium]|nr:PAS domain-containing protein [Elusimicrobiota bacterium]
MRFDKDSLWYPGIGFAVAGLLLAFGQRALNRYSQGMQRSALWVEHTYDVIRTIESLSSAVSRASANRRAYQITGEPSYILEHRHSAADAHSALAALRDLTRDSAFQQKNVLRLEDLVGARLSVMDDLLKAQARGGLDPRKSASLMARARTLDTRIHGLLTSMTRYEEGVLQLRAEEGQIGYRRTRILQYALTMASGLIILVILLRLSKEIADRQKKELDLRNSTVLMEVVIEGSSDSVFVKDAESRYLMMNTSGAKMIGRPLDGIIGKTDSELFSPETFARLKASDQEIIQSGRPKVYEYSVALPAGTKTFQSSKAPYRDPQGKIVGVIGIARDVTAQKAAEEKLQEAAQIKADFAAMVSHELRTPLTAIKLVIDMIVDRTLGPVNEEQNSALVTAQRSIDRLSRLINETLDFQKLESGKMEFRVSEADVNRLVQEVVISFEPVAKGRSITLLTNVAKDLPKVRCDKDKITQVVTNLLSNALKFTAGPITVSTAMDGSDVRVSVKDSGPGVSPEDQTRLFQSFVQLEGTRSIQGGTGLGLAISKKIIERHDGKIGIQSKVGDGATFFFTLPVDRSA